jgi:hypothetical protein
MLRYIALAVDVLKFGDGCRSYETGVEVLGHG